MVVEFRVEGPLILLECDKWVDRGEAVAESFEILGGATIYMDETGVLDEGRISDIIDTVIFGARHRQERDKGAAVIDCYIRYCYRR
jgi:hypothetical protein